MSNERTNHNFDTSKSTSKKGLFDKIQNWLVKGVPSKENSDPSGLATPKVDLTDAERESLRSVVEAEKSKIQLESSGDLLYQAFLDKKPFLEKITELKKLNPAQLKSVRERLQNTLNYANRTNGEESPLAKKASEGLEQFDLLVTQSEAEFKINPSVEFIFDQELIPADKITSELDKKTEDLTARFTFVSEVMQPHFSSENDGEEESESREREEQQARKFFRVGQEFVKKQQDNLKRKKDSESGRGYFYLESAFRQDQKTARSELKSSLAEIVNLQDRKNAIEAVVAGVVSQSGWEVLFDDKNIISDFISQLLLNDPQETSYQSLMATSDAKKVSPQEAYNRFPRSARSFFDTESRHALRDVCRSVQQAANEAGMTALAESVGSFASTAEKFVLKEDVEVFLVAELNRKIDAASRYYDFNDLERDVAESSILSEETKQSLKEEIALRAETTKKKTLSAAVTQLLQSDAQRFPRDFRSFRSEVDSLVRSTGFIPQESDFRALYPDAENTFEVARKEKSGQFSAEFRQKISTEISAVKTIEQSRDLEDILREADLRWETAVEDSPLNQEEKASLLTELFRELVQKVIDLNAVDVLPYGFTDSEFILPELRSKLEAMLNQAEFEYESQQIIEMESKIQSILDKALSDIHQSLERAPQAWNKVINLHAYDLGLQESSLSENMRNKLKNAKDIAVNKFYQELSEAREKYVRELKDKIDSTPLFQLQDASIGPFVHRMSDIIDKPSEGKLLFASIREDLILYRDEKVIERWNAELPGLIISINATNELDKLRELHSQIKDSLVPLDVKSEILDQIATKMQSL